MKLSLQSNGRILKDSPVVELPDFVVVTGKNGSGKTQLLKAIAFWESPREIYSNDNIPIENIIFSSPGIYDEDTSGQAHNIMLNLQQGWNNFYPMCFALGSCVDNYDIELTENLIQRANSNVVELLHNLSALTSSSAVINGPQRKIEGYEFKNVIDLCKRAGKNPTQIKFHDYIIFNNISSDLFSNILDILFHQYSLKARHYPEMVNGVEAPWVIFNSILEKADFSYILDYSESKDDFTLSHAILIDKLNGNRVNINELSSGEKTIMALIVTLYNSQNGALFPELLVMDEPDAFLHPSMAKQFLNVINEVLVKENGVRVILSTHSPSTVALAPEESVYLMNREIGYLVKGDKNEAIRTLTAGLATFNVTYEHRKQVFTEDNIDQYFYQDLFEKLVIENELDKDFILQFISVGVKKDPINAAINRNTKNKSDKINQGVASEVTVVSAENNEESIENFGNGGCTVVRDFTNRFYNDGKGNPHIFGIIDGDLKKNSKGGVDFNESTDRVIVLGNNRRHSLDNYLYDPLFVACYCINQQWDRKGELGIEKFDDINKIKDFTEAKLQTIINSVLNKVKPHIQSDTKNYYESDLLIDTELQNKKKVKLPEWFLYSQGHAIAEACVKSIDIIKSAKTSDRYIKSAILPNYWFLPQEIIETFKVLQKKPIEFEKRI